MNMSEGKIPKGPWTRSGHEENFGGDVFVYGADRRALARIYSPFADDGSDTRIAVADMMLAAPKLYEALQSIMHSADNLLRLVDELRERGEVDHWQSIQCADLAADVNIARNALLKASGGSDV
jgi:signal transduction histidine kinase